MFDGATDREHKQKPAVGGLILCKASQVCGTPCLQSILHFETNFSPSVQASELVSDCTVFHFRNTYHTICAMDENFNPNRAVYGSSALDGFGKASSNQTTGSNDMGAVAGVDAPLIAVLGGLEDGEVAVVGDLMAVRAGPETYHPIKALKVRSGCRQ